MGRYMLQRILIAIPVLIGVSLVVFFMMHSAGGDPAQQILGPRADPESVAELREEMGLNKPLPEQFVRWVWSALHGDFGTSLYTSLPVAQSIADRLGVTLSLALAGDGALLLGAGETALSNSNRFTSDPALPMVYRTANRTSLTNAA